MKKKSSGSGFTLSVQIVVLAAIAWAMVALLFFLLFSVPLPGQGRPEWYGPFTYILENGAFLAAGLLCFRNWRSPQIVSGRTVWLAFGLGMFSYFIGNLFLGYWEIGLGKEPDVSPGDFFFILTYLFWGWGMLLAVLSRQLNLALLQWLIVILIAVSGTVLAYLLNVAPTEQDAMLLHEPWRSQEILIAQAPTDAPAPVQAPPVSPAPPTAESPASDPAAAPAEEPSNAPGWAIAVENLLAPFADAIGWLYIIGDIILLVMAATLLLAFWGGRFSRSWQFIAAGAFSFYIADIWFSYATSYIENYETGALPEVFWIFSPCLFAIGAALEYDISTRSRRSSRRRGA